MKDEKAIDVWREKLAHLQTRQAIVSDAGQAFTIKKQIEEAKANILELGDSIEPGPGDGDGQVVSLTRLPMTGEHFIGREVELKALNDAWNEPGTNVISIVARGGEGKTALVKRWLGLMGADDCRGAGRVFGWSFYSQGTNDKAASADAFIDEALRFFGDSDPTAGSAHDRGERLARLVAMGRNLLVLDGLEPLQYPPVGGGVKREGELKDPALKTLITGLSAHNGGLCVITTREAVAEIADSADSVAPRMELKELAPEVGAGLLADLGVRGTKEELCEACVKFGGHALAITLLGTYLSEAFDGDIRCVAEVSLLEADEEEGGHAFRVIRSYERWLAGEMAGEAAGLGKKTSEALLTILRLLGLFDRPASAECIKVLRVEPVIPGLTEAIVGLSKTQWERHITRLRWLNLVAKPESEVRDDGSIDAHPLVREYFAKQLGERFAEGKREAHRRLYEYLKGSAPELPDTLQEMMPLYHAIVHGCAAGLYQEAYDEIHLRRVYRGDEYYSVTKLGAFGADLAALACLFERCWDKPEDGLGKRDRAVLLGQVGFDLRALGRLRECPGPMGAALDMMVASEEWDQSARAASNLSELHGALGAVGEAVRAAEQSVLLADHSGDAFWRMGSRTALADQLHMAGRLDEALETFAEAEALQKADQEQYPLLYSFQGFKYCDLLLDATLREVRSTKSEVRKMERTAVLSFREACREVRERAETTLKWALANNAPLLTIGLEHLTLGRTWLLEAEAVRALGEGGEADWAGLLDLAGQAFEESVGLLRQAGTQHELPRGLLARAAYYRVRGDMGRAKHDLAEAEGIAERGEMVSHQIDAALERCRLWLAQDDAQEARASLERAKALVKKTEAPYKPFVPDWDEWDAPGYVGVIKEGEIVGYHCRNGEIDDLEFRIGNLE